MTHMSTLMTTTQPLTQPVGHILPLSQWKLPPINTPQFVRQHIICLCVRALSRISGGQYTVLVISVSKGKNQNQNWGLNWTVDLENQFGETPLLAIEKSYFMLKYLVISSLSSFWLSGAIWCDCNLIIITTWFDIVACLANYPVFSTEGFPIYISDAWEWDSLIWPWSGWAVHWTRGVHSFGA